MQCAYVHETASGIDDWKRCAGVASKKEKSRVTFRRIGFHFLFGIDRKKNFSAGFGSFAQRVENVDRCFRTDAAVPGKRERADRFVGSKVQVHRKQKSAGSAEGSVVCNFGNGCFSVNVSGDTTSVP